MIVWKGFHLYLYAISEESHEKKKKSVGRAKNKCFTKYYYQIVKFNLIDKYSKTFYLLTFSIDWPPTIRLEVIEKLKEGYGIFNKNHTFDSGRFY